MIIDTETLSKWLFDYSPSVLVRDSGEIFFDGFCLYSEASETQTEKLIYVAQFSSLVPKQKLPGAACYICINDTHSKISASPFPTVPMLILETGADVAEVFNRLLNRYFERSHTETAFKSRILDLMACGATMDTILKVATDELQNPFIVFDNNFSLVSHSVPPSLNLPEAQHVVSNHYANIEVLQKLADKGIIDMLQHTTRPSLIPLPNGYAKLAVNIFNNRDCVGMIGFYNYIRPFEISDYAMVSFLSKIIGSYFHKNGYNFSVWTPYDYIFNYLLTNEDAPSQKMLADLNVSFPPQMRLMAVSLTSTMQMQSIPLKFIENSIAKELPKCRTYIHAQYVLFLCRSQLLEKESNDDFFTFLDGFLHKYGLCSGISNTFSDISDFKKVYEEASSALTIGQIFSDDHTYNFYVDYTIPHMLYLLNKSNDIERFYHPAFTALEEYDKKYNTQYFECLIVYLKYNGNMNDCASYFNIHYNSIKYRMKVISDICKIDLHDINTFIHLYLSYIIRTMYSSDDMPPIRLHP